MLGILNKSVGTRVERQINGRGVLHALQVSIPVSEKVAFLIFVESRNQHIFSLLLRLTGSCASLLWITAVTIPVIDCSLQYSKKSSLKSY